MFSKTPIELLSKDFSNIYNKCQAVYDLIDTRRYDTSLALLTASEIYSIAEKAYLRCDTFPELQTSEVENYVNAFDDFYFQLKQILFHNERDTDRLRINLRVMREAYENMNTSFNLF